MNLKNKILNKIKHKSPGYDLSYKLSPDELFKFRHEINKQYLNVLNINYPDFSHKFKNSSIYDYHFFSHLFNHEKLWNKSLRCLPQSFVEIVKEMKFYKKIISDLGHFEISFISYDDQVIIGQEEIYWRIVRPNQPKDVGPLHADKWFHEILKFDDKNLFQKGCETYKMWIPIYSEKGKNGLLVVPDSNIRSWSYEVIKKNGNPKPVLNERVKTKLLDTDPGDIVLFGDSLIHTGSLNVGTKTRVSVEITMVFSK